MSSPFPGILRGSNLALQDPSPSLTDLLRQEPDPFLSYAPPSRRTRVVITGVGAITPIGNTAAEFWASLLAGRNGVGPVTRFDASSFPTRFAAEVKDFDPARFMDLKDARRMSLCSQFALAAARMAFQDSGLEGAEIDLDRLGVYFGTAVGGYDVTEKSIRTLVSRGWTRISPFTIGAAMPNASAFQISLALGARAYLGTVTTACAAGTQAIGEAAEVIRRGAADVMVTGGTESPIIETSFAGFAQMRALSTRNDDPEHASRPFDSGRDGLVLGEGAGALVIESLSHARARGASIYAEVLGCGVSADAYHIAAPDPNAEGAKRAMQRALEDALLSGEEIDYINAHATSTPAGDAAEVLAIKKVLGERAYAIPVSSTKSMIGHTIGAAGALEAIVCAYTVRDQMVHPTINYQSPDPSCDLDCVPLQARSVSIRTVMSNSFGLGGQNACLILRQLRE